jgi:hypothetical protein
VTATKILWGRAPRRREKETWKCRGTFEQLCCTRDEGRSLGLGLQDQGPNHRKLLRLNGRGGERCGKRREKTRQVGCGKANASEPLMTYRKGLPDVAETRGGLHPWDKAQRKPADWLGGNRYLGGAIPTTGSCAERGNLCLDAKGELRSGKTVRGRVPMRDTGTDGFVVAMKPSNTGRAKGPDLPAKDIGQPPTGGADV